MGAVMKDLAGREHLFGPELRKLSKASAEARSPGLKQRSNFPVASWMRR